MPDPAPPTSPYYPAIKLNWEDWLPMIDDPSLSDAEKRVLIETLHGILVTFVDAGWGIALPEEASGQALDLTAVLVGSVLNSDEPQESEVV